MKGMAKVYRYGVWLAGSLLAATLQAQDSVYPKSEEPLGVQLCMTCHGAYGQGSPVVGGPNLTGMEPWYLRRQLESFRAQQRGTVSDYIPGYEMRATAMPLSDADIDQVVQVLGGWAAVESEHTIAGDAARGAVLYQDCAACHGQAAEGNAALGAPALAARNDWYLLRQLELFQSGQRGAHPADTYGAQMRAALAALEGGSDFNDLIAYINSLD